MDIRSRGFPRLWPGFVWKRRTLSARKRRRELGLGIEQLDPRIAPVVYVIPATADGTASNDTRDGPFETIDQLGERIGTNLPSDSQLSEQRGIFEFDIGSIPSDARIFSVSLRVFFTGPSVPAGTEYTNTLFTGFADDGQIDLGLLNRPGALLRDFAVPLSFTPTAPSVRNRDFFYLYDIGLTRDFFQTQLGSTNYIAIVSQMLTPNGQLDIRSLEDVENVSEYHPQLIIATDDSSLQSTVHVEVSPSFIAEDSGNAVGTVTVSRTGSDFTGPLTVALESTDPTEATVAPFVTIPANSASVTTPLIAVDDDLLDGTQTVRIIARPDFGHFGFELPTADPYFGGENGILIPGAQGSDDDGDPGVHADESFEHLIVQPDGKSVSLLSDTGKRRDGGARAWKLVRLNEDGSYDSTFGVGGVVNSELPSSVSFYVMTAGLTVQSDGKLVVVGHSAPTATGVQTYEWFMARYNPDGSVDTSFGINGIVRDPEFVTNFVAARNVQQVADDKLLVSGIRSDSTKTHALYAVSRYLPNGTPDPTFGQNGDATFDPSTPGITAVHSMVVQPDGKIVLVGSGRSVTELGVVRFTADGQIDTNFGLNGFASVDVGERSAIGEGVGLQADGKIVVAAHTLGTFPGVNRGGLAVVRFTADGKLDTTFATQGFDKLNLSTRESTIFLYSVLIQENGNILIAGPTGPSDGGNPILIDYLPDGSRNQEFGPNGIYIPAAPNGFGHQDRPTFYSIAFQPDGRLVALAASHGGAYVVRYGNSSPDPISNSFDVTDRESLTLAVSRTSFSETAGSQAAFGVVTRSNTDVDLPLTVVLNSSDTTEATIPASVVIPAGLMSASFSIAAIDDALFDNNQTVTFTATAARYSSGTNSVVVIDNESAGALFAGDILVTRPTGVANFYEIAEFTPAGVFVHSIPIPWGGTGGRPVGELLRDLIEDQFGKVYLFNGTATPFLTSYNPATQAVASQNFSGWTADTGSGAGGVATFHQFVFVSDSNTPVGIPAGIVRFDRRDNTVTRFSNALGYQDLTVGLNGLLYGLNQNRHVDVYDPVTMSLLSSFDLPAGDYRGLAVKANGQILAAGADGMVSLFDAGGILLSSVNSGAASLTDIDIEPSGRVIAGTLGGEVIVTDQDLTAPTKFTASSTQAFVAFAIEANFPTPTVHTTPGPITIPENDPPTPIDPGILVTDDGDVLLGATVTFSSGYQAGLDLLAFTNQNGIKGTFNAVTGTLTLAGVSSVANYQAALRSVLYQTASDTPAPSRTVTFTVSDGINTGSAIRVILVTSQNDPPRIFPNQIFPVAENSPNFMSVGSVVAFDDDSPVLSGFTIVSGNATGIFAINPATGQITVADGTQLDFESVTSYVLGITVSDGSLTSAVENVRILVTDENDNAPIIVPMVLFVFENVPDDTDIGEIEAVDLDTVGIAQDFTIVSGNEAGIFATEDEDPGEGELVVELGHLLDYETQKIYLLGVQCNDGVNTSQVRFIEVHVLDQNDVTPAVVPATFTVPENSINNTPVGTPAAIDIDTVGTLQDYTIVSGNASGAFQIDAVTGLITVNNSVPLNFETTTTFNLGVTVSDGLHTSGVQTITVQLSDVNESPALAPRTFTIPELSAGGLLIGTLLATDPDAGQSLTYAITSGNAATAFTLQPQTGVLTVQNGAVLDFETTPVYSFTVTATDNGNPTLFGSAVISVNLSNVNDPPTIDAGQIFTIPENSSNGVSVGSVRAHDADAGSTLIYSITGGNSSGAFAINPATGAISVADSTKLDFESTPTFVLAVKVTDNGVPALSASGQVVIQITNVNEAPVISPATFTVPENSPKPTFVGTVVATDQDAGQQKLFSIIGGNPNNAFSIHLTLGTITVNNPAMLDFETTPTFSLLVRVQDNGSPSLFSLGTITVNLTNAVDPPIVNDQTFSVSESAAAGVAVGTILAIDQDPGLPLVYQIVDGNANGTFSLDSQTGALTVANAAGLDFETQPSIALQVQVTKPGGTPLSTVATVTIQVLDANEAPVLHDTTLSVDENSASTTFVGTVSATDPDSGQLLTYSIMDGNTDGAFDVNPVTGEVRVANAAALNYEATPAYHLTVKVTDNGTPTLNSAAQVTIHLNDVNEPPVLNDQTVTIPENTAEGTVLATMSASNPEPDQSVTYSITAGDANGALFIDPATGQITVVDNSILNYEVLTQVVLTVKVVDGGQPSLSDIATLTINLTDVNDPPHFAPQTFTLEENSPVGTRVGTIAAVDEDAGQHIEYSVTGSDLDGLFAISSDGLISIAKPNLLDFETHPVIHFTIRASDDGNPSAAESHEFALTLTNVDEPPEIVLAPGVRILTKPLAKQAVDSSAFIRDVDTPVVDVANSTVQVQVVEHRAKSDKVRLLKSKHGDVVFKGRHVLYKGTEIGERIYGKKGAVPLTIHFNGAATQAAIEGVLQRISFRLKGSSGETRVLEYSLTSLNNGQSSHTDKSVQLG